MAQPPQEMNSLLSFSSVDNNHNKHSAKHFSLITEHTKEMLPLYDIFSAASCFIKRWRQNGGESPSIPTVNKSHGQTGFFP